MSDLISKGETPFQVTKEFLESQLNCKLESFSVESGTKPGENFMSVIYSISAQILLDSSVDSDKPTEANKKRETGHYLLKCYPVHPSRQKFLNKTNHFYNELTFYITLAKDLVQFQTDCAQATKHSVIYPAIPPCHGGSAVNFSKNENDTIEKVYSPLDNFILMTDMRKAFGYKMADRRIGLDVDHVKLAFVELATMHALSWAYRKKVEWNLIGKYPFLERPASERKTEMWLGILRENVDTAVAAIDFVKGKENVLSKAVLNFCQVDKIVLDYFKGQDEDSELQLQTFLNKTQQIDQTNFDHWRVICHGDVWTNNMLYRYSDTTGKPQSVIFVDFPMVKLGCPTLDLACLVYTSTRSSFRHKHLQECLQAYHDKFVEICSKLQVECLPNFSMDSLKNRFHTSKLVGLLIGLISFPLDLVGKEKQVDLEKMDESSSMDEMFQQACSVDVEKSLLYQKWIVELVQDLYDDGVIWSNTV